MCKIELVPNLWQPNNCIRSVYPSFHAPNNTVKKFFFYLISLFPSPNSPLYKACMYIITIVISHAIYFF